MAARVGSYERADLAGIIRRCFVARAIHARAVTTDEQSLMWEASYDVQGRAAMNSPRYTAATHEWG
jgi:hypothetical protein